MVDFVTDECGDSAQLDALLLSLATRLVRLSHSNYVKPPTFFGVSGRKILRDNVWGRMRFPFRADHKYYKAHKLYDFPQKDLKRRVRNTALILLAKIPSIRKMIYVKKMKRLMLKPYARILKKK